jgi:hypothetical protein
LSIGRDHHDIGTDRADVGLRRIIPDALRLEERQTEFCGTKLHGR